MKKVINAVKSNIRQILEIFVIIGAAILPQLVNLETLFKPYLTIIYHQTIGIGICHCHKESP